MTCSQLPSKERRRRCSRKCLKNVNIFTQNKLRSVQQPQMSCYNLNLSVLSDLTSMTCTRIHKSGSVVSEMMGKIFPTTNSIFFCTHMIGTPFLISSKKKKDQPYIEPATTCIWVNSPPIGIPQTVCKVWRWAEGDDWVGVPDCYNTVTMQMSWTSIKAIWASRTPQQCHRLIASMLWRTDAVIGAKGARTKY